MSSWWRIRTNANIFEKITQLIYSRRLYNAAMSGNPTSAAVRPRRKQMLDSCVPARGSLALILALVAATSLAADDRSLAGAHRPERHGIVSHTDLSYQNIAGVERARQVLDIYTHAELRDAPMILFIHGGSWRRGDKRAIGLKPLAFVPAGYVIASANYRFRPDVPVSEMALDVAHAVAWLRAHAGTYGGDPDRIVLMGHSAGAHLVALVGSGTTYLNAAGVPSEVVRAVIPLDTGPYHVPNQMQRLGIEAGRAAQGYGELMEFVFGTDARRWEAASPWHHVTARTPPFLVFTSEGRLDAPVQAQPFVEHLKAHGVRASLTEAKGRNHGTLNSQMGAPGDTTARQIIEFLRTVFD
jgi:arylformamidase